MIRSMTGYGRAREIIGDRDMTVEIKSVNHRYCETFVRISRSYMQIEDILRNYIQKNIFRGKIEIAVNIEKTGDSESRTLRLNDGLLREYITILKDAAEKYSLANDVSAISILKMPEVLQKEKEEPDTEELWRDLKTVVDLSLIHIYDNPYAYYELNYRSVSYSYTADDEESKTEAKSNADEFAANATSEQAYIDLAWANLAEETQTQYEEDGNTDYSLRTGISASSVPEAAADWMLSSEPVSYTHL